MWTKYSFLFFASLSIMSCKSSKQNFNPDDSKEEYIVFGLGGGFTGKVLKYYFTRSGIIYTQSEGTFKNIGSCSKRQAKQIFTNYTTLELEKINLNEPGNKYFFIESHLKKVSNKMTWGKDPLLNPNVETFFEILMNMVKTANKIQNQQ